MAQAWLCAAAATNKSVVSLAVSSQSTAGATQNLILPSNNTLVILTNVRDKSLFRGVSLSYVTEGTQLTEAAVSQPASELSTEELAVLAASRGG